MSSGSTIAIIVVVFVALAAAGIGIYWYLGGFDSGSSSPSSSSGGGLINSSTSGGYQGTGINPAAVQKIQQINQSANDEGLNIGQVFHALPPDQQATATVITKTDPTTGDTQVIGIGGGSNRDDPSNAPVVTKDKPSTEHPVDAPGGWIKVNDHNYGHPPQFYHKSADLKWWVPDDNIKEEQAAFDKRQNDLAHGTPAGKTQPLPKPAISDGGTTVVPYDQLTSRQKDYVKLKRSGLGKKFADIKYPDIAKQGGVPGY